MKLRTIVLTITVLTAAGMWAPQVLAEAYAAADTSARQESKWTKAFSRLTVGGYGEAVGTYNFYSDNVLATVRPWEHIISTVTMFSDISSLTVTAIRRVMHALICRTW